MGIGYWRVEKPTAGLLLSQFVADGQTQLDVSAFSPNRFDPAETMAYVQTTVTQANAIKRRH